LGVDGPSEIGDVVGGDGHQLPTDLAGFVEEIEFGGPRRQVSQVDRKILPMGRPVLIASPLSDRLTIPVLRALQAPFGRVQKRRGEVRHHADAHEGRNNES
jgi:hypothetical protein